MTNDDSMRIGFTMLKRWLENRNNGKTFSDYLASFGYSSVGIYGAGEIGILLYAELKGKLNVLYFIDRNAETYGNVDCVPVILPHDLFRNPECDIIVITALTDIDNISSIILSQHPNQPVIGIRDAVYEF